MNYQKVKQYVNKFLDREYEPSGYDGSTDFETCCEFVGMNKTILENEEVRKALMDAAKRTPAYKKIMWDEEKKALFDSFTWADKKLLKVLSVVEKVKRFISFHVRAWKAAIKIWKLRFEMFPTALVPFDGSEDKELTEFLEKNRKGKVEEVLGDPITIEAKIENHATGKVATAVWGKELKFDEGSKIVSYTVVPVRSVPDDITYSRPAGGFVSEGVIPEESDFRTSFEEKFEFEP